MKKSGYTLNIDTSDTKQVFVRVFSNSDPHKDMSRTGYHRSDGVLTLVDELLTQQQISPRDVTDVNVACGPGSYTGLRVGAIIGVVLATLLHIPLNSRSPSVLPELTYSDDAWC